MEGIMNSIGVISSFVLVLVLMSGCATHRSLHGGPSTGLAVDVDTPLGGVDASIGVHNPMVGGGGHGGGRTGGGCDAVLSAMEEAQPLMDWATNGGQGIQKKNAYGGASSGRRGGANCSASTNASSVQYNGQNIPPAGIRMKGSGPQGGGMDPSSQYQGGGGQQQYRRVDPREYHVPEQGPRGGYYGR